MGGWRRILWVPAVAVTIVASGCASIASNASTKLGDSLTAGIVDNDDPLTVESGLPAYLLLLDGLIVDDPDNASMLFAASKLYGAYGGSLVSDPARRSRLTERALNYARRGVCAEDAELCTAMDADFEAFDAALAEASVDDVPRLHTLGGAWASVIEAQRDDFDRIAELPKVEALFRRVVELDPSYDRGSGYMYLGVMATLRPESLGGKPDAGRAAFEKAIALSDGKNQMARVLYAEYYARLVFDQALHDRLLAEALAADPHAKGYTLSNVLAQKRARELVESGKDYF
jgi:hypothetical protein